MIILTKAGFKVLTARDGYEGMVAFEHFAADISLLLTDVQMPKVDGLKLASAARTIKPDLNVIFMSGYSPTEGITEAVAKGHSRFLPKPFTLYRLQEEVSGAFAVAESG